MKKRKSKQGRFTAWFNKNVSFQQKINIIYALGGCLAALIFCRGCANNEPRIERVEVPVEKIVYVEAEKQYESDALLVARVLYGLRDYQLTDTQKTAVIEVILNRAADTAREFRTVNTIEAVCNQPNQWQGYDPVGSFLEADYHLALQRLADISGARVIPEGCYFLKISNGTVTVRTEWNGGNEWKV